jgi:hypothetical protein
VIVSSTAATLCNAQRDVNAGRSTGRTPPSRRPAGLTGRDESAQGEIVLPPTRLALLAIVSTDALFALDCILAVFGVTQHPYIVRVANVFALLRLRAAGYFERMVSEAPRPISRRRFLEAGGATLLSASALARPACSPQLGARFRAG